MNSSTRGRAADKPTHIPIKGWWDILVRVSKQLSDDHVSLIAAGLALYALLAAFPAMTAIVSLYGLFSSPSEISEQLASLSGILPEQVIDIVNTQLSNLASRQNETLGIGALIAFMIALWSARKGMVALISATNIAYDEAEERGFIRQILVSLAFTIGAVVGFVIVALLAITLPVVVEAIGLDRILSFIIYTLRWILLWVLAVVALAIIYRYAPHRSAAKWRWITTGSAISATLWLGASILFSLYVRNYSNYGETYGALGGVITLLMWFYITGYIIILGAEINAEVEHQTKRDTTEGKYKPMGERGAHVADTLGRSTTDS